MPPVALAGLVFALLTGSAIARLVGASATIATLGLLNIVHSIAISAREITRGSQTFYGVPRVTDLAFVLIAAVVFILIARFYRESRWGLFARAARDDADAATLLGISPRRVRLMAWVLSGAMMTVAGALYGHILGAFSPASFYLNLVFDHVVMMIVGGMASVGGWCDCGDAFAERLSQPRRRRDRPRRDPARGVRPDHDCPEPRHPSGYLVAPQRDCRRL